MKIARLLFPIFLLLCLGAILFLADLNAATNAKKTNARDVLSQLTQACEAFYEEYQSLPLADGFATDTERITTGKNQNIMPPLCVSNTVGESPKYQTFFEYQAADEKKDGMKRTGENVELFDPWGHTYYVLFDYDYDKTLKDPFTGKTIKDRRILTWSTGPDGKSGTSKTNEDNIYSWK